MSKLRKPFKPSVRRLSGLTQAAHFPLEKETPMSTATSRFTKEATVGFSEWIILLMPLFEQLIAKLMERCAENEADAVEMMTNPSDFAYDRTARKVRRRLAREDRTFRRLSLSAQQRTVERLMMRHILVAQEKPELVCEMFVEAAAKRPEADTAILAGKSVEDTPA
jgi:hypothetical protein